MLNVGIALAAAAFGGSSGSVFLAPRSEPTGRWEGELSETRCGRRASDDELCLRLTLQRGASHHRSTWRLSIPVGQLDGLSARSADYTKGEVHFRLARAAGTLSFDGGFDGGFGSGEFVFRPDPESRRDLDKTADSRPSDLELLALAIQEADGGTRHAGRTDADADDDFDDDIDVDVDLGLGPDFVRRMVNVGVSAVNAVDVSGIVSSALRAVNPGFVSDVVRSSLDRIDLDDLASLGEAWQPRRHRHHHRDR